MSTGRELIFPLISGRTDTCSAGPMSPAAFTAKWMLRVSTIAVVGRAAKALALFAGRLVRHFWRPQAPPPKTAASTTILINHFFMRYRGDILTDYTRTCKEVFASHDFWAVSSNFRPWRLGVLA